MKKWSRQKTEAAWLKTETAINDAGVHDFVHPSEVIEPEDGGFQIGQELVLRILEWIARGPTVEAWGVRAWVTCYHLRPALCRPKTAEEFAVSRGVTFQAIQTQVYSFRAEFSEISWPSLRSRNGRQKLPTTNTPPGKESLPPSSP